MIDRIAITTCEIDEDLGTAFSIGTEWGIRNFELRSVWQKRVPRFTDEETAKLLDLVAQYGVNIVGMSPSVFRGPFSQEAAEEDFAVLDKAFELAERLDCRKIVVFSFRRAEEEAPDFILDEAVQVLREAAARAEKAGMELVHEPMINLYGDSSENLVRLVEAVDHPSFRVNWDPANMCNAGDQNVFPMGYEALRPFIRHVHLKNWTPEERWTVLSHGELDWSAILAALKRDGYGGHLTIETHHGPLVEKSRINYDWLKAELTTT